MKLPWYIEWFNSPFYHTLYFERDEQEASAFVDKLVSHLHPAPGSTMLDVGCGRGRHAVYLASKGFFVTGTDIAPASIEFAKNKESENLEFFVHDMRLPLRVNYFDYAFNFFTSFGYFRTKREHDDAIRSIAAALKTNGRFIIDYLNVHYAEDHLVANEEKQIGATLYSIHRWQNNSHFYKKIGIYNPLVTDTMEFTEKIAKFSLGDFTEMLAYAGLQVKEVFGDYRLNGYDIRKSPRLIIIAEKNK